jgi:hypothetical protein
MQRPTKRWYDAHEKLALLLEWLKNASPSDRETVVAGVLEIINDNAATLLEKYLLDFPLDQKRRRWYDQDPYLWLMVNGLEHASMRLLAKVTAFMIKKTSRSRKTVRKKRTPGKKQKVTAGAKGKRKGSRKRHR